MANKRMFTLSIVDSDAFLDLPLSSQALYFHLNMRADDDGFIGNPKRIQRLIGASEDDLKLLIAKRFVLVFEDGVIVIKHWRMHNTIRSDRYTATVYTDEKAMLGLKDNKSYTLNSGLPLGNHLATNGKQIASTGLGLDIGLDIDLDKEKKGDIPSTDVPGSKPNKPVKHQYGEFNHVLLTEQQKDKLITDYGEPIFNACIKKLDEYIQETGKKYKDHSLTIRRWVVDAVKGNLSTKQQPKSNNKFKNFQERQYSNEQQMEILRKKGVIQ